MGRSSTGAVNTGESLKIDINYLFRNGYIKRNSSVNKLLEWSDNHGNSAGSVGIHSSFIDEEKWIRLHYTITERNGNKKRLDYKVELFGIPSNLKRGFNYYFVCPSSGNLCKILFSAYGSEIFKSRNSYSNRIYYETQRCSKWDYPNTRFWNISKRLENFKKKQIRAKYRGKMTKTSLKLDKLQEEVYRFDNIRNLYLMNRFKHILKK